MLVLLFVVFFMTGLLLIHKVKRGTLTKKDKESLEITPKIVHLYKTEPEYNFTNDDPELLWHFQ